MTTCYDHCFDIFLCSLGPDEAFIGTDEKPGAVLFARRTSGHSGRVRSVLSQVCMCASVCVCVCVSVYLLRVADNSSAAVHAGPHHSNSLLPWTVWLVSCANAEPAVPQTFRHLVSQNHFLCYFWCPKGLSQGS